GYALAEVRFRDPWDTPSALPALGHGGDLVTGPTTSRSPAEVNSYNQTARRRTRSKAVTTPMPLDRPALLGGPPACPKRPPDGPPPDDAVAGALQAAWRDGSWGKYDGGRVRRLEERLAAEHGVSYALTCASGTFAVELSLRALKVGPGDEVVLAAYD